MSRTATLRHSLFASLVTIGAFLLLQACGGGGGGGGGAPPAPPSTPGVQNFPAGLSPVSVVVNPAGTFVYVANRDSNDISAYALNAATGMLTPIDADAATPGVQNFTAGSNPWSVTVNPAGTFVYVANRVTNDISAYTLNGNGSLTPIDADAVAPGIQNFTAGNGPNSVTVNPAGTYVYVANYSSDNISAYALNGDGSLTPIDADAATPGVQNFTAGSNPWSVTVNPAGTFVYVANIGSDNISAYALNGDGSLTPIDADAVAPGVQNFAAGDGPGLVTVNPAGTFVYVANAGSDDVSAYALNGDGSLTPIDADAVAPGIQNFTAGDQPRSITVTPAGTFVYVANAFSDDVSAYALNGDGSLTPIDADAVAPGIQNFTAGNGPTFVTVNPAGTFVYVTNELSSDVSAYTLDAATGLLTPIDAIP